jgi:hypothetical protein
VSSGTGRLVVAVVAPATLGLVLAVSVRPGAVGPAVEAYVLCLGALALTLLVRTTSVVVGPPTPSRLAGAPAGPAANDTRPPGLERVERELEMATQTAFDTYYRLRPLLRELAAVRLGRSGVELDGPGGMAEMLVGPDAWELVRPDVPVPTDHHAPGVRLPDVERALDALERLP